MIVESRCEESGICLKVDYNFLQIDGNLLFVFLKVFNLADWRLKVLKD